MVVNVYKHMGNVVIKILQGSAVTQTALGGLTIYLLVANFLSCICANNYGNWLAVDKVIAKIIWLTFLAHPVRIEFWNVVYAKHSNFVDVDASGAKSGTKYLELRLEVIQGHTFWDR